MIGVALGLGCTQGGNSTSLICDGSPLKGRLEGASPGTNEPSTPGLEAEAAGSVAFDPPAEVDLARLEPRLEPAAESAATQHAAAAAAAEARVAPPGEGGMERGACDVGSEEGGEAVMAREGSMRLRRSSLCPSRSVLCKKESNSKIYRIT